MLAATSGCTSSTPPPPAASRDQPDCLAPPWTFAPAGSSSDVQVSQCKDEHVYRLVLGSGSPASEGAQNKFLDAHREAFHAVQGIVSSGFGLCCTEDVPNPKDFCLVFDLRRCSTPLPEFIETVRELQAADSALASHSLRIAVRLEGLDGPRCEAGDDCGPLPYSDKGEQTPPETRTPVDPLKQDSETCSHDGECVANGCGNECDHWTLGGAAGTCPYFQKLEGAFCGCVEDHCAWFH